MSRHVLIRCRHCHTQHRLPAHHLVLDYNRQTRQLHAGWHNTCLAEWQTVEVAGHVWPDLIAAVGQVHMHETPAEVHERPDGPPLTEQDLFVFSTLLELVRSGYGNSERWNVLKLLETTP